MTRLSPILDPATAFSQGLRYSTYYGGKNGDVGYQVAVDAQGNIAITGYTLSPDLPVVGAVPQPTWGGGTDLFVARFKTGVGGKGAGLLELSRRDLHLPADRPFDPGDGSLLVVGYSGAGLPVTDDARQSIFFGGSADGFILVMK